MSLTVTEGHLNNQNLNDMTSEVIEGLKSNFTKPFYANIMKVQIFYNISMTSKVIKISQGHFYIMQKLNFFS